jgi:hypothetical protein
MRRPLPSREAIGKIKVILPRQRQYDLCYALHVAATRMATTKLEMSCTHLQAFSGSMQALKHGCAPTVTWSVPLQFVSKYLHLSRRAFLQEAHERAANR